MRRTILAAALVAGALAVPMRMTAAAPDEVARMTVTVTPRTGLVDDQAMLIRVRNEEPNGFFIMKQCPASAAAYSDNCDYITRLVTGTQGNFDIRRPADVIVDRRRGGPVDCRVTPCDLVVHDAQGPDVRHPFVIRIPLQFDPGGPDPVRPTTTASPDQERHDGDVVTITGNGYPIRAFKPADAQEGDDGPARPVYLYQCRAEPYSYLDCQFGRVVGMTPAGHFQGTFEVQARLFLDNGGSVDCTTDPCVLLATSNDELSEAGEVPLTFADDEPSTPDPTVTVTPPDGLSENETVTITGHDFAPDMGVELALCPPGAAGWSFWVCHSPFDLENPFAATDENGDVTFTHAAHPVLHRPHGQDVDCRAVTCSFVITWADVDEAPSAPVLFDPVAPAAPPQLTASPSTGLTGGQEVDLSGSGYARVRDTRLIQCVVRSGIAPNARTYRTVCGRFGRSVTLPGDRRSFETHLAVRQRIVVDGARIDCARRACYVATIDQENDLVRGSRLRFSA